MSDPMPDVEVGDIVLTHQPPSPLAQAHYAVRSELAAEDWNTVNRDRIQAIYRPIWRKGR